MKVAIHETRGVHVLACGGELMLGRGEADLQHACRQALDAGARYLVLDLSGVRAMDSAGIGAVVRCGKEAGERGAILKIAAVPDGRVRKVFELTSLDRLFEVFDDVEAAVRSYP